MNGELCVMSQGGRSCVLFIVGIRLSTHPKKPLRTLCLCYSYLFQIRLSVESDTDHS